MTLLAARDWHAPDPAATRRARACLGTGLVALVAGAAALGGWLFTGEST